MENNPSNRTKIIKIINMISFLMFFNIFTSFLLNYNKSENAMSRKKLKFKHFLIVFNTKWGGIKCLVIII